MKNSDAINIIIMIIPMSLVIYVSVICLSTSKISKNDSIINNNDTNITRTSITTNTNPLYDLTIILKHEIEEYFK
jgi:hypothetical protein